jgi:NAD+ synthase (glutamine-hydrolysing)
MRLIRIAIASVNTTVSAVTSNVARALEQARAAARDGASLVVLNEQLIAGYCPEDLVQWRAFVAAQWTELERFARETADLPAAIAIGLTVARGSHVYNAAAMVHRGKILGIVPKEKLPTYNVFYEARVFARGAAGLYDEIHGHIPFGDLVFEFDFGTVALEICEDIWSPDGPMRRRSYAGAEVILNLSASPFRLGVVSTRREMIATRAADNQCVVAYANLVGGNDGLVFDGGGFVAQNGRLLVEAPRFVEGFVATTVDLDRTRRLRSETTTWRDDQQTFAAEGKKPTSISVTTEVLGRDVLVYPIPRGRSFFLPSPAAAGAGAETPPGSARRDFCEDLLDALALGLGDYFEKTGAFKVIGVALSGGRDSLLCLYLARRWVTKRFGALGPEGEKAKARELLRAFFMPSRYSSRETHLAAEQAAKDLDAPLCVVSIDDAFEPELTRIASMLQPGENLGPMARQNAQARIRALRMWTWANSAGGLFLQTSNMSEKSVGYTTIGGDMEGALSVIANVPKTVVNYLLDYLLETTNMEGIALTLKKPASAELADGQEDEKDLMPFPVLDACFALYAGEKMSPTEVRDVLRVMFPEFERSVVDAWATRFARLFTQSIYKWVQTPLCLHVGNLDLDRERALQLPVVQRTEWA